MFRVAPRALCHAEEPVGQQQEANHMLSRTFFLISFSNSATLLPRISAIANRNVGHASLSRRVGWLLLITWFHWLVLSLRYSIILCDSGWLSMHCTKNNQSIQSIKMRMRSNWHNLRLLRLRLEPRPAVNCCTAAELKFTSSTGKATFSWVNPSHPSQLV